MKLLRTSARLVLLLLLSGAVLVVCGLGMEMNRQGLVSALAKQPLVGGQLLQPFAETFNRGTEPADWLAIGMTLLMFAGVWFACHEVLKLRHLARDRGTYVRDGDGEKAALAREVMHDLRFWLAILVLPVAILIGFNFYLLSQYTQVERVWLSLGIALLGPLMFAYLSDRIVGTWDVLCSMLREYKDTATSAWGAPTGSPLAFEASNIGQSAPEGQPAPNPQGANSSAERRPAPPLRIDLPVSAMRVPTGENAEFRWSITGARSAVLHARERDTRSVLPMQGSLLVAAPLEEETLDLIVTGFDGRQAIRTLRITPTVVGVDDPLTELKLLDASWN